MNASHVALFQWIAQTHAAAPWLMVLARWMALGGAWLSAAVVACAVWRRPAQWRYIVMVVVACTVTTLLSHQLARWLDWPRPFVLGLSLNYISHGVSAAMPSTHASVMFALALLFRRRPALSEWGLVLATLALLTGAARVYVGVHFPMDIAAGFLLAYMVVAAFGALQELLRLCFGAAQPAGGVQL